jgi:TonB family protein
MRAHSQTRRRWGSALRVLAFSLMTVSASGQESRKLIAQPVPVYPELARRARLSGTVKVEVLIAANGQVKVIGGHPLFVDATTEALKKWKYALSNSETSAELEFNFHP